ncbi:MAG: dephospho-CoA kinase, partial [Planctomycetota bacterium]
MTARVLGITGAVGSGKSTLARLLAERGARLVDADATAHRVLVQPEVRDTLVRRFGTTVLGADGAIAPAVLAKAAFTDAASLRRLTDVVYPVIREALAAEIHRLKREAESPIVLDAPTLFEARCEDLADCVVTVEVDPALAEARSARARGWPKGEAARRERFKVPGAARRG